MVLPTSRDLSEPLPELVFSVRRKHRERLDLYLLRRLGWSSRTKVQKLIAFGRVEVNGSAARSSLKVSCGDQIRVILNVGGEAVFEGDTPIPAPLWEDAYLLAIDKPAGRLVHPTGRTVGGTIVNELHHRYRGSNRRGLRPVVPKLCHRLDRDTSGVLLIAKNDFARQSLQKAFEIEAVEKQYLAVVEGEFAEPVVEVRLPILVALDRSLRTGNRLARAAEGGKPSHTTVRRVHCGDGFSVVCCRPHTGRQNQIRAHLAGIGHPIVGDVGYESDRNRWENRSPIPFPDRALLHSRQLSFDHPVWGTRHRLSASPPQDFQPFLDMDTSSYE